MRTRASSVRLGASARRMGLACLATVALVLAGCGAILESSPEPTPADFPGIASELAKRGLDLEDIVSGDDGCHDATLTATAIGFDATGLGQTEPVHLRVYIFRNGDAYERRRPDVDTCVAVWATDPPTFVLIDAKPFVLAGQGPWTDEFKATVRAAMLTAAGNGG